jgi:hypothetical protein
MSNHQRACHPLLLGNLKELRRKIADNFAIEPLKAQRPKAIQD